MIALYPGAFKPPHRGHFNVVKSLLDGSYNGTLYNKDDYKEKASSLFNGGSNSKPKIDKVIIFIGGGERNGIDKIEATAIWNIYIKHLGNVEIVDGQKNPMFAAKDYAREYPEDQFVAVTGLRGEEDFVDLKRVTTFNNVENVEGLALQSAPGSGVRATDFRKSILSGNLDKIIDFFPKQLSREEIVNIL
jgi:nicotinamide mononucleotide adenylyltransferase